MKKCSHCQQEMPLTCFGKNVSRKDGLQAECRACMKARVYAWRATARGQTLTRQSNERYRKSPGGVANRKASSEQGRMQVYRKRWKKSPAGMAYQATYRKTDKRKAVVKKYSTSPKGRATQRRNNASEKGKARLARGTHKRRAKLANCVSTLTAQEWTDIREAQGHCCFYCHRKMKRLTMDHVIPLSKGGNHTKENVVGACRSCNSKKGDRVRPS